MQTTTRDQGLPATNAIEHHIRLEGLVKSFGAVHAVRGIDLIIGRGETVALLGPNGAGKSTTIDMLLGLTAPDEGEVALFGRSPARAIAAGLVGAMFQTGSLIRDLSVRELLTLLAALYPAPLGVDEVLERAGITELAERRTQQLSGGESQRVRFAAALISNPELIVLDEPTVAMDVEGRHRFWAAMRAFANTGRTVLFATHYLEEADEFADRIVLMAQGRVVADGPATEIKARVGGRIIRLTAPDSIAAEFELLPGVTGVEVRGEAVTLSCSDSDSAMRELVRRFPRARDFEIRGAGLEDAFLALTSAPADDTTHTEPTGATR